MAVRFDPRAYWSGGNRYLAIALGGLLAILINLFAGPVAEKLEETRTRLEERRAGFERWQNDFRQYHPISEAERAQWAAEFDRLRNWIPEAEDEAEQIAEVARLFEMPSTRDLEAQPGEPFDEVGLQLEDEWSFESPVDGTKLDIRAIPLQVSFKSSYEDLDGLLARIEGKELPLYLDQIRVRRLFAELQVRLDIVIFLRRGEAV